MNSSQMSNQVRAAIIVTVGAVVAAAIAALATLGVPFLTTQVAGAGTCPEGRYVVAENLKFKDPIWDPIWDPISGPGVRYLVVSMPTVKYHCIKSKQEAI